MTPLIVIASLIALAMICWTIIEVADRVCALLLTQSNREEKK